MATADGMQAVHKAHFNDATGLYTFGAHYVRLDVGHTPVQPLYDLQVPLHFPMPLTSRYSAVLHDPELRQLQMHKLLKRADRAKARRRSASLRVPRTRTTNCQKRPPRSY